MVIGIIGCGDICHTYIREIKRLYSDKLYIKAVANRTREKAVLMAQQYEIDCVQTVEEMLKDEEIELIVNLTVPKAHHEINKRILKAGKHVFCEKPIAFSVEEVEELEALAKEKKLCVGSAPDTFLTAPVQTCKKLIEEGWIGKVTSVTANMMSSGPEDWHPSPDFFYKEGAGPLLDMGGYYLTTMIELLGPVTEVFAYAGKAMEERMIYSQPKAGTKIRVEVPTHYTALLRTKSGVIIDMTMSFDIWYSSKPNLEIYGTEGTLIVPDPNFSDGVPRLYRKEQKLRACYGLEAEKDPKEIPLRYQSLAYYVRGTGVAEMAEAIRENRPFRANLSLAKHVIEIMMGIQKSAACKEAVAIREWNEA